MSTCARQLTFSLKAKENSDGHSYEFPLSIPSFCPGVTGNQKQAMSAFSYKSKPSEVLCLIVSYRRPFLWDKV